MVVVVDETERTDDDDDDDDDEEDNGENNKHPQQQHGIELVIEPAPTLSNSSSSDNSDDIDRPRRPSSSSRQRRQSFRPVLRRWVVQRLTHLAVAAARYPVWTISLSVVLTVGLAAAGYFTNAQIDILATNHNNSNNNDVDETTRLWTPSGTATQSRETWIRETFTSTPAQFTLLFHHHGESNDENILTAALVHRMFDALETIQELPLYGELCGGDGDTATANVTTTTMGGGDGVISHSLCRIYGATGFWDHVRPDASLTDAVAVAKMGSSVTNDGSGYDIPTPHEQFFGRLVRNNNTNKSSLLLVSAASARLLLQVPRVPGLTQRWERAALAAILRLRRENDDDNDKDNGHQKIAIQVWGGETSIPDELVRSLSQDLPLVPIVLLTMTLCACSLLGGSITLGLVAIAAVVLSILSGAGLLGLFGVPWTSATQLVPFLMLGIGLDDAIVLHSTWRRIGAASTTTIVEKEDNDNENDGSSSPSSSSSLIQTHMVDRVRQTIEECGLSIFLTTLTSLLAFLLGSFTSSVPAIYWLCQYCAPMVALILFFQLTFFVAWLVLTEQRRTSQPKQKRQQLRHVAKWQNSSGPHDHQHRPSNQARPPMLDGCMGRYADVLLGLPKMVKWFIVVLFLAFFAVCVWRIPKLTQDLNLQDFLPADSYITDFYRALERYSTGGEQLLPINVYLRGGYDYSNATVRAQIRNRVQDGLIGQKVVSTTQNNVTTTSNFQGPLRSWIDAFEIYTALSPPQGSFAADLDGFLAHPLFGPTFAGDIVFGDDNKDNDGNDDDDDAARVVAASRISLWLAVDTSDIDRQLQTFAIANRFVTDSMFSHHKMYNVWEFYAKIVPEVVMTTTLGVVAVAIVSLLFVPRWGALHVIGMMIILYSDLIGVVQLSGRHLSGITFVCLCMSIGLLGDFSLHIVMRFEEGHRCGRDTLRAMGAPVLMGGVTTLLGIVPLAFSTSEAFRTVFVIFLGIVTLGVGHALILLPLILEATTTTTRTTTTTTTTAATTTTTPTTTA